MIHMFGLARYSRHSQLQRGMRHLPLHFVVVTHVNFIIIFVSRVVFSWLLLLSSILWQSFGLTKWYLSIPWVRSSDCHRHRAYKMVIIRIARNDDKEFTFEIESYLDDELMTASWGLNENEIIPIIQRGFLPAKYLSLHVRPVPAI